MSEALTNDGHSEMDGNGKLLHHPTVDIVTPIDLLNTTMPLDADCGGVAAAGNPPLLYADDADGKSEIGGLKSVDSMPRLLPMTSDTSPGAKKDVHADADDWVPVEKLPFNMRIMNLNNFPSTQTLFRTSYRAHSTACVRAKLGSVQNTAKSLDLVRNLLQKFIDKEINVIIQKYVVDFFQPALENIRLNAGDAAVSDEHMQTVCRQILEEAKKMYVSSDSRLSFMPFDNNADSASDTGSQCEPRSLRHAQLLGYRKRRLSSSSESSSVTHRLKKRGRPPHLQGGSGRSTPSRSTKSDTVRRQGPLWDPDRLKADTLFVMGSKANKALGLGATRGRLYIKHPDIFKYGGDQDDKAWLHERQYMPATGGRTYLLIADDIRDLAQTDEYRSSGLLQLQELEPGFSVPEWMLEKMRCQMRLMRTDIGRRPSKLLHDSTPVISSQEASPANMNTLSPEPDDDDDDDINNNDVDDDRPSYVASPLNATGGFDELTVSEMTHAAVEVFNGAAEFTDSFYNG